jgi:hypothetical protein
MAVARESRAKNRGEVDYRPARPFGPLPPHHPPFVWLVHWRISQAMARFAWRRARTARGAGQQAARAGQSTELATRWTRTEKPSGYLYLSNTTAVDATEIATERRRNGRLTVAGWREGDIFLQMIRIIYRKWRRRALQSERTKIANADRRFCLASTELPQHSHLTPCAWRC